MPQTQTAALPINRLSKPRTLIFSRFYEISVHADRHGDQSMLIKYYVLSTGAWLHPIYYGSMSVCLNITIFLYVFIDNDFPKYEFGMLNSDSLHYIVCMYIYFAVMLNL